jgi:hypothetical protein
MEENPLASEKEIKRLFDAASRGNKDMEAEIVKSFVPAEYRDLVAKSKN